MFVRTRARASPAAREEGVGLGAAHVGKGQARAQEAPGLPAQEGLPGLPGLKLIIIV